MAQDNKAVPFTAILLFRSEMPILPILQVQCFDVKLWVFATRSQPVSSLLVRLRSARLFFFIVGLGAEPERAYWNEIVR
jgi:hypothetical protein